MTPSRFALRLFVMVVVATLPRALHSAEPPNLVKNGSFEDDANEDGVPDSWSTSGRADIKQELTLDAGHDGGKSVKLDCTEFVGGTPDAHAMVCQVNTIAVKRGQWYKLSFWTKAEGMQRPMCSAALSRTKPWGSSGISAQFAVSPTWRRIEKVCQASADVPDDASRLQFWYGSTGTLWLDDVVLEPIDMRVEFHPQIATEGVRNVIPNSSFECGGAGWGSYAPGVQTWAGNLSELIGEIDETTAFHGERSLRIEHHKATAPVFHWDYFDPVVQPLHTIVAAHHGWVPLESGKPCTLTCYLKADKPNVPALMMARLNTTGTHRHAVKVGTEWQRYTTTFRPNADYLWSGVGIDLTESDLESATLWVDAVQFEFGDAATNYAPRATAQSFIETAAPGNVFTDPKQGLSAEVSLWNGTDAARDTKGTLVVTDFEDKEVVRREVSHKVDAGALARVPVTGLAAGRRGFYRVAWEPEGHTSPFPQTLRCALLDPYQQADSPFGMNHAYPWDSMLGLCKTAGLTWMRDWSAKWHTLEPEQGKWDFSKVDPQIDRVIATKCNPLMLLPFASAPWCSGADMEVIREQAQGNSYNERRYVVACPAKDPALFRNYVKRTVEHYRNRITHYEIMNEPLYTTYAVPQRFGYDMDDYLAVLKDAYEVIKADQPKAQVIGGIGTWAGNHWVHEFIDAGGLKWCDAMDIHLYPVTIPPELYEDELAACWKRMQDRGEAKPIWLTEFGCYADDDPYKTPAMIGDSAMSRANWGTERDAAEGLVKTAAVFLTHGVAKIFYHAGTCGAINTERGGGIFFEYGGAPRKMYAAVSALANLLGPKPEPVALPKADRPLRTYVFRTAHGGVAIVWSASEEDVGIQLPPGITPKDMMGNTIPGQTVAVSSTPVYLTAPDPAQLVAWAD